MGIKTNDILYKPYIEKYKTPLGALYSLQEVTLHVYIRVTYNVYDLNIVLYDDNKTELIKSLYTSGYEGDYRIYTVTFSMKEENIYWYYFEFQDCYGKHYLGRDHALDAIIYDEHVKSFQLSINADEDADFSWYQGKVMYQILVDRFRKSGNNPMKKEGYLHKSWDEDVSYVPINGHHNIDFYGGDLQGVIKKLPYLKQLNVGVIYLNPIFLSPSSHKYNTSDYLMIDPMYGTTEDFTDLCQKARELGIYIIIDGVFNHTGDDSIYFNKHGNFPSLGAYQSKDSPYYSWYKFKHHPNKYDSWWGIETLPAVNQNSSFCSFITDEVIEKWMKCGIKGFRLDVVDELNDEFVQKINKAIKKGDANAIVIGEVWEDASNKISYGKRRSYFNKQELDTVMNYVIKDAIIDYLKNNKLDYLVYKMREIINNYHPRTLNLLMNILSTHDTARILSVFSHVNEHSLSQKEKSKYTMTKEDYFQARSKLKMAFTILYTIPGVPCIFYGDEAGLEGYRDPFCRRPMPWGKIDENILGYLKSLGEIRNNPIFVDGKYEEVIHEESVLIYARIKNDKKIIVIINDSNYEYYYNMTYGIDLIDKVTRKDYVVVYPQTAKIIEIGQEKQ